MLVFIHGTEYIHIVYNTSNINNAIIGDRIQKNSYTYIQFFNIRTENILIFYILISDNFTSKFYVKISLTYKINLVKNLIY